MPTTASKRSFQGGGEIENGHEQSDTIETSSSVTESIHSIRGKRIMGQIMALRKNTTFGLQELLLRDPWASIQKSEELQVVTDNPPLE